jgi:predicted transcriptional regulator
MLDGLPDHDHQLKASKCAATLREVCNTRMASEVVTIRLEPALRDAVDAAAADRGISRSVMIREALMPLVDPDLLEAGRRARQATAIRDGFREHLLLTTRDFGEHFPYGLGWRRRSGQ